MVTMSDRMTKIETQVSNISKTLDDHVKEQREDIKEIKSLFEKYDKVKANKWIEKAFVGLVISLLLGSLGILLTFILGKL